MVLIQQIVNGVMLGSSYSLIAIGYTLVFGVLHLVHLAHGEVFMIGAFIGLQAVLLTGGGIGVALPAAAVSAAFVGVLIYLVAIKPIRARKGHFLAPMISTIGAGVVLQELATRFFGSEQAGFPVTMDSQIWHLGGITLTSVQLVILAVSLGLMLALHLFVTLSRVGMAMRATAESMTISHTLGIRSERIIILTFAIASALAGVAGVLVGMSFNSISPYMGVDMGIKGLAAMLLGGLGNVYGAMVGGLVIGIVEVISVAYLASSYRDAFSFFVIIAVLLFRPRGIFGSTAHIEAYMLDPYTESVLIFAGINVILALGLYLPVSAGLLSLGQGGFMAIGAYTAAYLTTELQCSFLVALLCGCVAAGLVGFVIGIPSLRIKGIYLVIMTMGFGEIVRVFFLNFDPTGAASGMGGIATHTTLPGVAIAVVLTLLLCFQLRGSRIGRAIEAVREDELAAEVIGINLTYVKVAVFGLGAAISGLGGGLYAHYATFIDPAQFGFQRSAEIFIMVVLGGMGNFLGAAIGAIVVTVLPELLRLANAQESRMLVFGALLVIIMIVRPWGLLGMRR